MPGSLGRTVSEIYKVCAESLKDQSHLRTLVREAQKIVANALS
jgi:hypothetical protein